MLLRVRNIILIVGSLTILLWGGLILVEANSQTTPSVLYGSGDFFLPPYLSDHERMGFGKTSSHDAAILNAGWYVDWGAQANPSHPGGAVYARTIYFNISTQAVPPCYPFGVPAVSRSQVTANLTGTALSQNVQANLGALWLIGNEPDSIYNGSPIQPELYAELYHDYYTSIKTADPTAKVAVAAIVQPSPLRMEYLDKVLTHYQATYGEPLPTDLWNIHFYYLREVLCDWGAGVPPDSSQSTGWNYEWEDTPRVSFDVTIMETNLRAFRQWMFERGYGDKPLIITEFGVLYPPDYAGFDNVTVAQYLNDIFDVLLTVADPTTGLTADSNRLAQMWAWFSTNHWYGGDLFCGDDTDNKEYDPLCHDNPDDLTTVGQAFVAQTNAYYTPYVDLQPAPPMAALTAANTLTVSAHIQNRGNSTATVALASITLTDPTNGAVMAEETLNLEPVSKRYTGDPTLAAQTWRVSTTETITTTVPYSVNITVVSVDANPANNTLLYQANWRPLIDLAVIGIEFSTGSLFLYHEPVTVVATATVTNRGRWPAPQTTLEFVVESSEQQRQLATDNLIVLPLLPSGSAYLTATIPVTQVGAFEVSAVLPTSIDPAELYTANNRYTATLLAANEIIYMPLILKQTG